jgi:hypothetical protein
MMISAVAGSHVRDGTNETLGRLDRLGQALVCQERLLVLVPRKPRRIRRSI